MNEFSIGRLEIGDLPVPLRIRYVDTRCLIDGSSKVTARQQQARLSHRQKQDQHQQHSSDRICGDYHWQQEQGLGGDNQEDDGASTKMILASDTVYPGKPFSDAEAFFEMAAALLDPEGGVILLTYTPRQPSICTENMLRSAYRAGLTGNAVLDEAGKFWHEACNAPSRSAQLVCSQHNWSNSWTDLRCAVSGFDGVGVSLEEKNISSSIGPKYASNVVFVPRRAFKWRRKLGSEHCTKATASQTGDVGSHTGATPMNPNVRKEIPTSDRSKPILLAFSRLPTEQIDRNGSLSCNSELAWLSEWRPVFPNLPKRHDDS